jgi:sialate O-acetylesterase
MKKSVFLSLLLCLALSAQAKVSLPKIFSDNMVLQRDQKIKVWGWADAGERITVTLNGVNVKTKADSKGNWAVTLNALQVGGPYELSVSGKDSEIKLKNILSGDIWLGSGQSNMEWPLKETKDAELEIANSHYPTLRLFTVPKAMSYTPLPDLQGGQWVECKPKTAAEFSAVAYYFGLKLNAQLDVPIGVINTSWGGTNIQTWISWDMMSQKEGYRNVDVASLQAKASELKELQKKFEDAIKNEKGNLERWYQSTSTDNWKKIYMPKMWEATEIGNADGYIWFRKDFVIPSELEGKKATISLGPIDDADETYLNGVLIGSTNQWNKSRNYEIADGMLKQRNTVVIRVHDTGGGGGIYGKPEDVFVQVGDDKFPLAGDWLYRPSVLTTQFGISEYGPNAFPSQLYNAMVAPITPFSIKGVIWYQGESNTWEAYRYRKLFPEMINNWRQKWGQQFPFLWVQLANFMAEDSIPAQSEWAELREAQSMTLSVPATGQALAIDIGEAADIHPRNKKDVGNRLAVSALKIAYQKDVVFSGPVYQSMEKSDNKILLTFNEVGKGLVVKDKYGYLKGFAIAGEDRKFVWAQGYLENGKVVVFNETVKNPVAVRYAWGNNPADANLYNQDGFPATPFRTDNWQGVSQGANDK